MSIRYYNSIENEGLRWRLRLVWSSLGLETLSSWVAFGDGSVGEVGFVSNENEWLTSNE